jgi:hypothetical protein
LRVSLAFSRTEARHLRRSATRLGQNHLRTLHGIRITVAAMGMDSCSCDLGRRDSHAEYSSVQFWSSEAGATVKAQELSPEGRCVNLISVPWRRLRYGLPERNKLGKLGLVQETVGARDAVMVEDDWSRMTGRG